MRLRPLSVVTLAAVVLLIACNRTPANKTADPAKIAAAPQNSAQPSAPAAPVSNATAAQPSPVPQASSAAASSDSPQSASTAKLVQAEHTQSFAVAQQEFRLITHTQTIEGTSDETVDWWELRNSKDRVIYRGTYPASVENGSFAETLAINGSAFNTAQGGGILIHGFELPSAPGDGGWVQVFGFKYGREKYGVDESLFGSFGPPISIDGEFVGVGADTVQPTPVSFGRASVTIMHDVLRFRLWTGNFSIVYPVLINWITGRLQPGARCIETTSKGRVERCAYPVRVEDHRDNQPTFVRLFPEPDDNFTPKHIIVQASSKVEFIEARCPVAWNEDNKAISFNLNGDNWLKVRVDGVEGWIHGEEDFEALGLPQSG